MTQNAVSRVTVRTTPKDRRKTPSCLDFNNPVTFGRFLQSHNPDLHGTVEIVRGAELPWAQEVLAQVQAGHNFFETNEAAQ